MTSYSDYLPYAFALVLAIPFLVLLRQFVTVYTNLKERELKMLAIKEGNDLRFQSFERMTLFLERIKPVNLVARFDKTLAPHEFLFLTEKSIHEEFEYNTAQQVYMSSVNWKNIVSAKEQILNMLRSTHEGLGAHANLEDFKSLFLLNYLNEGDFISETIDELKKELLILNYKS